MSVRRFSVIVKFDLVIDDEEEAEFLASVDGDDYTDRDLAVWYYLTNWVSGNNSYKPGRSRSCVEYHGMEVDEDVD